MKKYINFMLIALIPAIFTNCDSPFLDLSDPDAFDEAKFYQTEQDMEDALTAAYQATRTFYNWMFFATEMKADNASTTDVSSGGIYTSFSTHNVTSSNTIVSNIWNGLYNTIYKSNIVLKYIDRVPMSEDSRKRITAEAKYLRALSHFYLIRLYGPVPVLSKLVETTAEAKQAKRQPLSDAYALIISDLTFAANCDALPATIAGNSEKLGHATRTAANAILGKVYLTMGATLQDGNNTTNYTEAVKFLKQACTLANYNDFPSGATFPKIFGTANEGNEELIFQCMYLATSSENSGFAYYFQPIGNIGLTSQKVGRGWNEGEANLADEYETGDRRKATSIIATATGLYYTKKYVDLSSDLGYGGNNWIEIRFADVFLMLAEAYDQLNDKEQAIAYLNKVRVRASLRSYDDSDAAYHAKYPTLREAIFHERRMELAFENHRWFDLLRQFPNAQDFVNYMRTKQGPKYSSFMAFELLLPIPYDEIVFNPNFYQNDGY